MSDELTTPRVQPGDLVRLSRRVHEAGCVGRVGDLAVVSGATPKQVVARVNPGRVASFVATLSQGDVRPLQGGVAVGRGASAAGDGLAMGEGAVAEAGQVVLRPAGTDLELVITLPGEAHQELVRQVKLALRRKVL